MPADSTSVRGLLAGPGFRRLYGTRLTAQFGDGVFQAALAGTVLFNPQSAADPLAVAAGFAVLLLPWSVLGPFAGVLLDRWSRRQVLLVANVLRAGLVAGVAALIAAQAQGVAFYLAGLAVFSVNRFVLSALSAGLPHVADPTALVTANALSTTSGSVSAVAGGGVAIGALQLIGADSSGYAVLALCAALPYLAAAAVVRGFPRPALGPDRAAPVQPGNVRSVAAGLVAGARHVLARRPATVALATIGAHRLVYGVFTLMTLLLYRDGFPADGTLFPTGLAGLAEVLAAGAAGTLLAAVATPPAVARIGTGGWTRGLLALAGITQLGLAALLRPGPFVAAALVLAFVAQGIKICVDSTLQASIDDDVRGRVFSVYDTLFNVTFVAAVSAGAVLLPADGRSVPALLVMGCAYLLLSGVPQRGKRALTTPSPARLHQ